MFYKPGAAIQKNLADADGSRDNLPELSKKPKQFGLGIKRESPKHYQINENNFKKKEKIKCQLLYI